MDTTHLKKRGQSWYVQIAVPGKLQATIGKKTITQALNTRDPAEASKRKHQVVADIMHLFARHEGSTPGWGAEKSIIRDARAARAEVTRGEVDEREAQRQWQAGIWEFQDHHPDITPAQSNA
ncbi:MAG: hypothetical protein QNK31_06270, partial [Porticoccus sp.]|nr:hypothetical protein [Porticoccus sp.]